MLFLKEKKEGFEFKLYVLPKSSKNMICGLFEDSLKIKITAPPVDGSANKLCIKFLSKCLKVPKSSIEIISGLTGRKKKVIIHFQGDEITTEKKKDLKKKILSLIL